MSSINKQLLSTEQQELLDILKNRFEKNMNRHIGLEWDKIKSKLEASTEKLYSLSEMERTWWEPDVVEFDNKKVNISSTTSLQKAPQVAGISAMTMKL